MTQFYQVPSHHKLKFHCLIPLIYLGNIIGVHIGEEKEDLLFQLAKHWAKPYYCLNKCINENSHQNLGIGRQEGNR